MAVVVLVLAVIGLAVALGIFVTKYNDEKGGMEESATLKQLLEDQKNLLHELEHITEHLEEEEMGREKDKGKVCSKHPYVSSSLN